MELMSCTGRFIRPFVRVLAGRVEPHALNLERVTALDADRRVKLQDAYRTVSYWVERTGDSDLGLKAGEQMCLGSGGVLEYAMHSARSVREAVSVAQRYIRLFSDALEPKLQIEGNQALLRIDNRVEWPRAIADFTMSSWYNVHVRVQLAEAPLVEVWFAHEAPADTSEYERVFARARLRFGAPCYGFAFDAELADRPLASSDTVLHAVHCEHLEVLHAGLPAPQNLAMRVRELVAGELRHGRPTAVGVARKLHMSRRTLVRKLDAEGTSFTAQLDELRRQLALRFVATPKLPLNEITDLLGFSHVQGFHRAFKRWTGQTPIQYRETAQSGSLRTAV
jgi:AraC-like DNA-binding protein